VATARAFAPAGESTVSVRLDHRITRGLYGVDLTARQGSRATRAEQYVFLGGSLTRRSITNIENQIFEDELNNDPRAESTVNACHRFDSLRVDCLIEDQEQGETYVEAWSLTPQGQLRARTYNRRGRSVFQRNPRWNGPAIWGDLGAAWNPDFFPNEG
jgi:hypothetical protein